MKTPVISIADVQKSYGGLRPLRLRSLHVAPGERVALSGLDAVAAELLVNLITGASLPDQGTIATFGRETSGIADSEAWLGSLEKFGIVSPRAVLLEGSSLRQNLALPFTLSIDDIPADVEERITALARECGIVEEALSQIAAEAPPHVRMRMHLARALALEPELLLIEHPTADVPEHERVPLARDVAGVTGRRNLTALIVTLDADFAEAVAHRSLAVEPGTGAVVPWKRKRGWFR